MSNASPLAAQLKLHFDSTKETQRAFQAATGLDMKSLGRVLNGTQAHVQLDTGVRIARHLNVRPEILVGEQPIGAPPVAAINGAAPALPAGPLPPGFASIGVDRIRASKLNPRKSFDAGEIAALAESIKIDGLLQPMLVRPVAKDGTAIPAESWNPDDPETAYEVIAGERRLQGCTLLVDQGHYDIAQPLVCKVRCCSDAEALGLALIENLQRVDLEPTEEAAALNALVSDCGFTVQEIAVKIHKTDRYVQGRIQLHRNLAPEVKKAMLEGEIGVKEASHFARIPVEQQKQVLEKSWNKPGDISERMIGSVIDKMIPVSRAIFERALYSGEIAWEEGRNVYSEGTGKQVEYFCDAAQFRKLQAQAVKAKIKEFTAEGWGWVEKRAFYHAHEYKDEKLTAKKDRAKAGVLIVLDSSQRVEIHRGLVKKPAGKANGSGGPKETAEQKTRREKRESDAKAKCATEDAETLKAVKAMVVHLLKDTDEALRLIAFSALYNIDFERCPWLPEKLAGKKLNQLDWNDLKKLTAAELMQISLAGGQAFDDFGERNWQGQLQKSPARYKEIAKAAGVKVPAHIEFK